ncbi:MAG: putative transposase [Actinomycetes bacterium]
MVAVARVHKGPPLPIPAAPTGSVPIAPGVDMIEGDEGGVVFLWAMAAWCWSPTDVATRRLAALQLVSTRSASRKAVAVAFGVDETSLWRWGQLYASGGVAALEPSAKGPKGPSKLTKEKIAEIVALRGRAMSMEKIAARVGVSLNSVSRALRSAPSTSSGTAAGSPGTGLVPLARPEPRTDERQAARAGELIEAPPVITQGSSLPLAGALVILPALAATGLVEVAGTIFTRARAAFYGVRSLVLTVVFAALVGEPRAEGLNRINPADLGRLLGLDRAPEVRTIRRRFEALSAQKRSDQLIAALAHRHTEANPAAAGVFYVDGHVRAYHGKADVPKAHLARMRLAMPAAADTWVADARGDGVLVWCEEPGASLVGELRRVATEVRALVGPDARPTIIFDRGGWSPKLFAELVAAGFHIATYRKGPNPVEPASAFLSHRHIDEAGRAHDYLLGDRNVRIPYDGKKRYFACRQITRLQDGHQTQVLTTRADPDPAPVAHAMFSRWRQENFFRYMRAHFALDGLDSYATVADDLTRAVTNQAKRAAAAAVAEAKAAIATAEAGYGRAAKAGVTGEVAKALAGLGTAIDGAKGHLGELAATAKATPAKAPLGDSHPDARRLDPERKRIFDAIRMATYNAESDLARLLGPHYARSEDEARSFLREVYNSPADLEVVDGQLHVRINPLSAPRRSRALAALCTDLTATETIYPGTDLVLVYSVKGFETVQLLPV